MLRLIRMMVMATTLGVGIAHAEPPATVNVAIESQPLRAALKEFGRQTGLQVMLRIEDLPTEGITAPAVSGTMSPQSALDKLLSMSGLRYEFINDHTVRVMGIVHNATLSSGEEEGRAPQENEKTFRVAQVGQGASAPSAPLKTNSADIQDSNPTTSIHLEEVVVTAQKKTERLQDVPIPVTAVDAQTLVESNQVLLRDFYSDIPGLTVAPAATQSYQLLSIRGITTGGGSNPTVGITIDDVPFGSSTNLGGGTVVPDIDPADLARLEVLRGPQGTLYGANSMGGLIKFVTADPSFDRITGRIQAGMDAVQNGTGLGYTVRGSINVPLTESLAMLVSGFTRKDPGYIDNPILNLNGVNEDHANGGRVAVLWRPAEVFSAKLSALYQDTRGEGSNDVNRDVNGYTGAPLGDLQQNYLLGIGGYDRRVQAYSLTLAAQVGGATLTSLTGYNINQYNDSWDLTYSLGSCCTLPTLHVTGSPTTDYNKTDKFTQELRLSMSIGTRLDWLVGGFYTHESSQNLEADFGQNESGAIVGETLAINFPITYEEEAAFTDLTIRFTDQFDVQMGARDSNIRQTFNETEVGTFDQLFFGQSSPIVVPEERSSANAFTYLLTPRLKITPDIMVYARFASGYRPGGANAIGPQQPAQYDPDKTINYELGLKADFLEDKLSVDTSAYYIDWKDIQLQLLNEQISQTYTTNAGHAKSQGLEVSAQARPWSGAALKGWIAWDEAVLTQAFPPTAFRAVGVAGDPLPYNARFSGNLSFQEYIPLNAHLTGLVGADLSYVGQREGVFTGSSQRETYPSYAKVDLHTGARMDDWSVTLYANNVTNRRGALSGGLGQFPPFAYTLIQPRTIGLTLSRQF